MLRNFPLRGASSGERKSGTQWSVPACQIAGLNAPASTPPISTKPAGAAFVVRTTSSAAAARPGAGAASASQAANPPPAH